MTPSTTIRPLPASNLVAVLAAAALALPGLALAATEALPSGVKVAFRHPAYDAEDRVIDLVCQPDGGFSSQQTISDGVWIVEVDAQTGRERPYRQVRRVFVRNGAIE